jgi:hypothetical protein
MAICDSDDCAVFRYNHIAGTVPLKIFRLLAKMLGCDLPTSFAERETCYATAKMGFVAEVQQ